VTAPVLVPFEPLEDVEGAGVTEFLCDRRGVMRAAAAAADEQHRLALVRTCSTNSRSNAEFRVPPGQVFHSMNTASGTRPTHSHSARVRTSTSFAPGSF